jgi:predicted transglutaminase-like cysteine proteinase
VGQTVKLIVAAAAIVATVTALHQAAKADLVPQAATDQELQPLNSADGPIPFLDLQHQIEFSYLNPGPILFLDLQQKIAFSFPATPSTESPQPASFELPKQREALAPAHDLELAPKRSDSLGPSQDAPRVPVPQSRPPISRIQFGTPALAPMSHTFFCLKYRDDCKVEKTTLDAGVMALAPQRWAELVRVNGAVNHSIIPHPNTKGLAGEVWLISPKEGECHDYAVTKRHKLIALGWPEQDLLLAEVVTSWGEHHLVLVIRTSDGDFVADNLNPNIRIWTQVPYQWVRIQSAGDPKIWSTVAGTTVSASSRGKLHRS